MFKAVSKYLALILMVCSTWQAFGQIYKKISYESRKNLSDQLSSSVADLIERKLKQESYKENHARPNVSSYIEFDHVRLDEDAKKYFSEEQEKRKKLLKRFEETAKKMMEELGVEDADLSSGEAKESTGPSLKFGDLNLNIDQYQIEDILKKTLPSEERPLALSLSLPDEGFKEIMPFDYSIESYIKKIEVTIILSSIVDEKLEKEVKELVIEKSSFIEIDKQNFVVKVGRAKLIDVQEEKKEVTKIMKKY